MEFQQNFPVDKLIPYARNSRTHNDEQVAQIMASIKEFGFTNPILIGSDNVIIAGHGRLLAAQRLGMTEVPVIVLPDLTETQRRALVIADNRIALNAGWDEKMLALEIGELKDEDFDLTNLGFTDDELKALENFGEIQDTGNTEDDEVPEAPVEPTSKHGDVWQLGNHRLMCGDTTMIDDFKKLMQNDVADMIFTDPPYNVNYGATMKDKLRYHTSPNHGRTIMNDNLGEDFEQFLYDACTNMLMYCKGAAYVCMSSSELHTLYSAFVKAGGKWSTFIIWAKNTFTLGRADYQRQYEPKGNKRLIFDTKYKTFEGLDSFSNSDVFQVTTYCLLHEAKKAILIYPQWTKEKLDIAPCNLNTPGDVKPYEIQFKTVNLMQDIKKNLSSIITEVNQILEDGTRQAEA